MACMLCGPSAETLPSPDSQPFGSHNMTKYYKPIN